MREERGSWSWHRRRLQPKKGEQEDLQYSLTVFLQGESWLSAGLRVTLSPRAVLQDRGTAITLEIGLQESYREMQTVPLPDAAQ